MTDSKPIERILVIRGGALGDVILTMPAISAIRQTYPTASICVVGNEEAWRLATDLVDEVRSVDSRHFSSLYGSKASSALRDWLKGFDLVISWSSYDFRPVLEAAGVPLLISASPYPPPGVHSAEWFFQTLARFLNTHAETRDFRLHSPSGEIVGAPASFTNPGTVRRVMIHPGAGSTWKRWRAERFAAVARALKVSGNRVVLIEGPADAEAVAEVQEHLETRAPTIFEPDLRRLAGALSQADLFIGNDSGVTHLSAVLGIQTIGLFGPTDPSCWAPLGDSLVLRHCREVTARQGQVRVCEDPHCLLSIRVEDVLQELRRKGFLN